MHFTKKNQKSISSTSKAFKNEHKIFGTFKDFPEAMGKLYIYGHFYTFCKFTSGVQTTARDGILGN